jgi:hypothetical protein
VNIVNEQTPSLERRLNTILPSWFFRIRTVRVGSGCAATPTSRITGELLVGWSSYEVKILVCSPSVHLSTPSQTKFSTRSLVLTPANRQSLRHRPRQKPILRKTSTEKAAGAAVGHPCSWEAAEVAAKQSRLPAGGKTAVLRCCRWRNCSGIPQPSSGAVSPCRKVYLPTQPATSRRRSGYRVA